MQMLASVIIVGLLTGSLIGSVGVGGILLSPLLVIILDIDLHLAMATSSWSFLFTGVVGTLSYARRGSISWRMVAWLSLGILPAAVLGAWTNVALPTNILTVVLAALITFSGINALYKRPTSERNESNFDKFGLVFIGLITGFGSALTGTGGPVLLIPILLFFKNPVLGSVGVSQAIQLPIAIFTSLGFLLYGQVDLQLGTQLGLVQAVGVLLGARIAHSLPSARLRQMVAGALIVVGVLMIGRVLF